MIALTPSLLSPFSTTSTLEESLLSASSETTTANSSLVASGAPPTTRPRRDFRIPTVVLDKEEALGNDLAASLTTCLINHVLFLKSQIPFPVAQLERMSRSTTLSQISTGTKSGGLANRSVQKRVALLDASDSLASHLMNTFGALSTALAMRAQRSAARGSGSVRNGSAVVKKEQPISGDRTKVAKGRAVVQLVLGVTVGAPKARVVLVIDGLELKMGSEREEGQQIDSRNREDVTANPQSDDRSSDVEGEGTKEDELQDIPVGDDDTAIPPPDSSSEPTDDDISEDDGDPKDPPARSEQSTTEAATTFPTPIRSPSGPRTTPLSATRGLAENFPFAYKPGENTPPRRPPVAFTPLRDPPIDAPAPGRTPLGPLPALVQSVNSSPFGVLARKTRDEGSLGKNENGVTERTPSTTRPLARLNTPFTVTPCSEVATRAAERLLSRTLAEACAEPSSGFAAELAPTQTHILLRAPRGFRHPSWVPRQRETMGLDKAMFAFLADSGIDCPAPMVDKDAEELPDGNENSDTKTTKVKKPRGPASDGIWVGACGDDLIPETIENTQAIDGNDDVGEEDEMIWWEWDGKFVGFSEW